MLDGDGEVGFATPLATLHRFQGWADKFLTTPAQGIDDRYVSLGVLKRGIGGLYSLSATAAYHDFQTARHALALGQEVDLQLQLKWRRLTGTIKYAR